MAITNALASVAVRDLPAASSWYEQLLGPGNQPMPEVVEWQLDGGGGLQVYLAPERAGHTSATLITDDIDEIGRRLDAEPVRTDRVDTIMVKDPDGNSVAFSQPKDAALAR